MNKRFGRSSKRLKHCGFHFTCIRNHRSGACWMPTTTDSARKSTLCLRDGDRLALLSIVEGLLHSVMVGDHGRELRRLRVRL